MEDANLVSVVQIRTGDDYARDSLSNCTESSSAPESPLHFWNTLYVRALPNEKKVWNVNWLLVNGVAEATRAAYSSMLEDVLSSSIITVQEPSQLETLH